jgi:two-component system response regulator DesR
VIRVLLAEDVRILREALAGLLDQEDDLEVVAQVPAGDAIVASALRTRPDVAVLDIELPGMDGLSAAAELARHAPGCRTLILTGVGRPGMLRRAMAAGVAGFMVKDSAPGELVEAVRTVAAGGRVVDPQLAFAALDAPDCPLTDRELEVLRLIARGMSNKDIGLELVIAENTVRNHVRNILEKLQVRSRVEAAMYAVREKLVDAP